MKRRNRITAKTKQTSAPRQRDRDFLMVDLTNDQETAEDLRRLAALKFNGNRSAATRAAIKAMAGQISA